jgi:hypothetical protein
MVLKIITIKARSRIRIRIFFLREGGERLGLAVEEEERLGLALVLSVFNCTNISRGVPS